MPSPDQITLIEQLKSQGKTLAEIAAIVGMEMGDVESVINTAEVLPHTTPASPSLLQVVRFPFSFDTPNLYDTGVDLSSVHVAKAGDVICGYGVRVLTVWDQPVVPDFGPGPVAGQGGIFQLAGSDALTERFKFTESIGSGGGLLSGEPTGLFGLYADDPLVLWATTNSFYTPDGSAAPDPLPTQGEAELFFLVAVASS